MIKVEKIAVWGFEHAVRGMRNPMDSWNKSDSGYGCGVGLCDDCNIAVKCDSSYCDYVLGVHDIDLMQRLYKSGTEHRKYLRQIDVSMDIVAPLYWWKEFDTYKIGVTSNSCSTMHKIDSEPLGMADFSREHLFAASEDALHDIIVIINKYRGEYVKTGDKRYWWQMIQLLPSSYNQRRTIQMNYENVMNIINQREHHKLDEWRSFVEKLKKLPYVMEIRDEKETK